MRARWSATRWNTACGPFVCAPLVFAGCAQARGVLVWLERNSKREMSEWEFRYRFRVTPRPNEDSDWLSIPVFHEDKKEGRVGISTSPALHLPLRGPRLQIGDKSPAPACLPCSCRPFCGLHSLLSLRTSTTERGRVKLFALSCRSVGRRFWIASAAAVSFPARLLHRRVALYMRRRS
ncbi:hypothetical protein C8R47DRAFT_515595 [Mycena vitilis]|nr:hypothetical protein C8R47DRAFT_515595 [Mycena vitilis]